MTDEAPIRPDGGKYFPLGFDRTDSDKFEKTIDTSGWAYNGAMHNDNFWWFGLYNFGKSEIEDLMDEYSGEWKKLHELLCKLIWSEFDLTFLTEDEKYELSKLTQKCFVNIEDGRALPNFCVFTSEQYKRLEETVFEPISIILSDEIVELSKEFEQYCKTIIPSQLKSYFSLFVLYALGDIGYLTTIFAFNDKKLYVPKDNRDGEFLTFMYIKR